MTQVEILEIEKADAKERRNKLLPNDPMWHYWDGQIMAYSYAIGVIGNLADKEKTINEIEIHRKENKTIVNQMIGLN